MLKKCRLMQTDENLAAVSLTPDLRKIADEVARGVFKELDYHNEAYNAELFLKKHRFLPFVTAPQWLPEYTGPKGTARVL